MNQRIFPMSLVSGCVLLMALILLQSAHAAQGSAIDDGWRLHRPDNHAT